MKTLHCILFAMAIIAFLCWCHSSVQIFVIRYQTLLFNKMIHNTPPFKSILDCFFSPCKVKAPTLNNVLKSDNFTLSSRLSRYIDSSCAVGCISYNLVTPVNRQTQSDGYEWRLFSYDNHLFPFDGHGYFMVKTTCPMS